MLIHISGAGPNMAATLATACDNAEIPHLDGDASCTGTREDSVVIHVGSAERFVRTLRFCELNHVPLVQAATGQNDLLPKYPPKCPIILAPNCALPMIALAERIIPAMKVFLALGMNVRMDEEHQAAKMDWPSGTALTFAEKLGFPRDRIGVVRRGKDPHALHTMTFRFLDLEIRFVTKCTGRQIYAAGALKIAEAILTRESPLENRIYNVGEILKL